MADAPAPIQRMLDATMHFDLDGVRRDGDDWIVTATSRSDRFNGTDDLRITRDGDRIARLVIAATSSRLLAARTTQERPIGAENPGVFSSLKQRRESRRKIRESEEYLRRTVDLLDAETNRRRGEVLWLLGNELANEGRLEEAARRLGDAWDATKRGDGMAGIAAHSRIAQAIVLLKLSRHEDGVQILERILELRLDFPQFPDLLPSAKLSLVSGLECLGRYEDADERAQALIAELGLGETVKQREYLVEACAARARLAVLLGEIETP